MGRFTFTPGADEAPEHFVPQVMRIASDAGQAGWPDTVFEIMLPHGVAYTLPNGLPLTRVNIDACTNRFKLLAYYGVSHVITPRRRESSSSVARRTLDFAQKHRAWVLVEITRGHGAHPARHRYVVIYAGNSYAMVLDKIQAARR